MPFVTHRLPGNSSAAIALTIFANTTSTVNCWTYSLIIAERLAIFRSWPSAEQAQCPLWLAIPRLRYFRDQGNTDPEPASEGAVGWALGLHRASVEGEACAQALYESDKGDHFLVQFEQGGPGVGPRIWASDVPEGVEGEYLC